MRKRRPVPAGGCWRPGGAGMTVISPVGIAVTGTIEPVAVAATTGASRVTVVVAVAVPGPVRSSGAVAGAAVAASGAVTSPAGVAVGGGAGVDVGGAYGGGGGGTVASSRVASSSACSARDDGHLARDVRDAAERRPALHAELLPLAHVDPARMTAHGSEPRSGRSAAGGGGAASRRTAGRARCPPRVAIASRNASRARTTASRFGCQPRRSHSSIHSPGVRWPRSPLQRRQAATSFSIQLGPPLIRGTRCSVVAATRPTSTGRRHQTHSAPSRSRIAAMRSRRSSWRSIAASTVRRNGAARAETAPVTGRFAPSPDRAAARRQPAHGPARLAGRTSGGVTVPRAHGGPRPRHVVAGPRGAPARRAARDRARLGRRRRPPERALRPLRRRHRRARRPGA